MDFEIVELSEPYTPPPTNPPGTFVLPYDYWYAVYADGTLIIYTTDKSDADQAVAYLERVEGTPDERSRQWYAKQRHEQQLRRHRERHARKQGR